ncbi:MAG: TonB-dependent receptor plug domain-containing protein [Paludibacteraceae bacterium]|nr:TonB-dependent receptor plug domain-containing protein [Paludibacteraceae bacterium]
MKKIVLVFSALFLVSVAVWAQYETNVIPFNGLVVDMLGQPLRNVRVFTFDRHFYSISDRKGRFGLSNVQDSDTIHIIYHRRQYDIPVDGRKSMRIVLGDQYVEQVTQSVELVNLGYGYVSRRESVSSSAGITGEMLRRTGCVRILDALQGLVPGLSVTTNMMGEPTVYIRGINSINCDTTPLYIVDGVEVSSLEMINIYDVESVEVMKDAYIYGSRGANGAILITTLTGRSGPNY